MIVLVTGLSSWPVRFALQALPWQYPRTPSLARDAAHIAIGQLLQAVNEH